MIVWDLVPKQWREDAFIAGGYAACPALASDLDLWIPCCSDGTRVEVARDEVWAHLRNMRITAVEENEETITQYEGVNVVIMKVCCVYYGVKIHIMVVDAPLNAVLEGFDVSTHQVALLPSGEVFTGSRWTPITEPPVRLIDTPKTDVRMEKITNRYRRRVNAEAA